MCNQFMTFQHRIRIGLYIDGYGIYMNCALATRTGPLIAIFGPRERILCSPSQGQTDFDIWVDYLTVWD